MREKAYLVLQNGRVFEGRRFGAKADVYGEAVFTTAMTGYVETLTDPSYHGQLVVQTFPLIGNVGVMAEDFESGYPQLSGYIVREACDVPSNFRCEKTLEQFLIEKNVPGLCGVDTRAITRLLRSSGVMKACILSELPADMDALLKKLQDLPDPNSVPAVTGTRLKDETPENPLVLMDFGYKENILRCLEGMGYPVKVVPADTSAEDILKMKPCGVMLSNGPGDPAVNVGPIETIRALMDTKTLPIFGICLGHQLMALAMGAKSTKMKFGHRGANQPVIDLRDHRLFVTSQNHGYAIDAATLPAFARPLFVNANDNTLEGVWYEDRPAFSVQFHPEACGGPRDTAFLFDDFRKLIEEGGNQKCR